MKQGGVEDQDAKTMEAVMLIEDTINEIERLRMKKIEGKNKKLEDIQCQQQ